MPGRVGSGRGSKSHRFLIENLLKTIDFHRFFFAFLCSGNIPAPGASGDGFGGPGAYFSPIAGRRSGRYLRSKRGIRLQAQLRLAHVPTRSLAFLARFAPVPTRIFVGPYSPLAGAILEGPRGQNSYFKPRISTTPKFARSGDDAASRSDPTFTRASQGLRQ